MTDVDGSITLRELRDDERAWANAQYRAIQFAVTPPDAVALVAEIGDARVGLGRLVELEAGVLELGGIWTDDSVRGRGVARAMVTALLARIGLEVASGSAGGAGCVWCIPFSHLAAFYQSFGFAVSAPPWPAAIAAKVDACVANALPPVMVLARSMAAR